MKGGCPRGIPVQGFSLFASSLLVVAAIVFAGCAQTAPARCKIEEYPRDQAAICNNPGSFSFAYQAQNWTRTESHIWENPRDRALVTTSNQLVGGSVELKITDGREAIVYVDSWAAGDHINNSEHTRETADGVWKIQISLSSATGQVGIQVTAS